MTKMKTKMLTLILVLVAFASPTPAQTESWKFMDIEVNKTNCDTVKILMDSTYVEMEKSHAAKIYVVFYTGKRYLNMIWNARRNTYDSKYLPPKRGEAKARATFYKSFLMNMRPIDDSSIKVIDGGYRENPVVELWIIPAGAKPPVPTPTLSERDIRFRKGKPKRSDMFAESCG